MRHDDAQRCQRSGSRSTIVHGVLVRDIARPMLTGTSAARVIAILFLTVFVSAGCGGEDGSNQASTTTAAANTQTAELIRETEGERLKALIEGNAEAASKFHADDFQLITPGGQSLSKEEYMHAISAGGLDYAEWKPVSPIKVRVYGDGAVIRYRSTIRISTGFGGSAMPFWHTDVYEKRNGTWQVVWSQATGAG